jgi:hypothetical protein
MTQTSKSLKNLEADQALNLDIAPYKTRSRHRKFHLLFFK